MFPHLDKTIYKPLHLVVQYITMVYLVALLIVISGLALWQAYSFFVPELPKPIISDIPAVDPNFDWETTEPLPIRTFVGKRDFRPSMGVQNFKKLPEQWLLMENTYKNCTSKKREITEKHTETTIQVNPSPRSVLAAREFYDLVVRFLVQRYPMYFIKKGDQIYNKVNDDYIPASLKGQDPVQLYLYISRTIEEDVVVFMKDDPNNEEEEYALRSTITGFPAGFDPSVNHNKVISEIHDVVPQYKERLKLGMGRLFNRIEPTDLWIRHNWSMQTHNELFAVDNHGRPGEKVHQLKVEDIDFENACFLRCERQVLTRLPKLRANFMTVRTYLTPIKQIKAEGLGPELIHAIDSLPEDLGHYKKRPAWGEAIKEYLRS